MSMRRAARERASLTVSLRMFGWERAGVAALRHGTLPWLNAFAPEVVLDAAPLREVRDLGGRDRLSLVAQFAAHQAFLQFAGIGDGELDAAEWAVVRKRGCDCRLVRIAARTHVDDAPPVLTVIQQFADAIDAPALDVLRQSWGRAEAVYCDVERRLRRDAAADLRWMRGAAVGEVISPGIDALRSLLAERRGRFARRDEASIEVLRNAAALGSERLLVLGDDASPLARYSAIEPLTALAGPLRDRRENEIVERVVASCASERVIVIVRKSDAFDPASRAVLRMLAATDCCTWIDAGGDGAELPESRHFVLSPRLSVSRGLDALLAAWPAGERRQRMEALVMAPQFERYLDDGELPREADALAHVREPARSYVAALALLGTRTPRALARQFLAQFVSGDADADMLVDGVTSLDGEDVVFADAATRDAALALIPPASRPQLCRVAAELLESVSWPSCEAAVAALRALPAAALTAPLRQTLANALLACGRYRDAGEIADDDVTLGRIERRLGDYGAALARLGTRDDFAAALLRGELLHLMGRVDEARSAFDSCRPESDSERVRLGYARGVLAVERGATEDRSWMTLDSPAAPYLLARLESYRCEAGGDCDGAVLAAERALAQARTTAERIDAALDRLFALFSCGRWEECRAEAMSLLAMIEETQGDRAAGGVLFTLAYLCADDGQWSHAAQRIARLKHFYAGTRDERRLAELELLAAHLDFSRGRFESARAAAEMILAEDVPPQIREAAALIVDEIATLLRQRTALLSTGRTGNRELTDRHALLRARRGENAPPIAGAFTRALAAWERGNGEQPDPTSGSERLKLLRAALAKDDRNLAEALARELRIDLETADAGVETRVLHAAATRDFPYHPHDFGPLRWRLATRNRLGHWSETGSLPPLAAAELDALLAVPPRDCAVISDRELLVVEGLSRWAPETAETLAAIIRTRSEQHRLRRIVEQEEDPRPAARAESVDGIVGQSPAMRQVFALITRVAKRDVPVCVLGESGTGKELVARAIHRHSTRRPKVFTAVNCAALPENLIESELFGHSRGAFTGAERDRAGLIETTDGGTLFLDEIGEMPAAAQAKLLRFLQEGEFRRVGETANRTADVRIVTATNRKLESAVEEGRFREDLYYRIRVVEIALPALRDRASDIPLLAAHFVASEQAKHRGGATKLTPDAEGAIAAYGWPGNVRELQNTLRAAHALAGESKAIDLDHLPERVRNAAGGRAALNSYHDAVARFRRDLIEKSLQQVMGNQNRAASLLKISRQALAYQIRELGIMVGRV
jgi:DNA-binding NtrC family response regulator